MTFDPKIPSTTESGETRPSDEKSLSVGADGPLMLHDVALVQKLARFDRERIPERSPHAKGSGAFGEFTVTGDVSKYTRRPSCNLDPRAGHWPDSPPLPVSWAPPTPGGTCAASP